MLAATLLLVAVAAHFLFFYDFQAHKERLTAELAQHLAQPVRIGEVSFSLRHGPALSFSSLEIGSGSGAAFHLRAERLLLRMEWRALWQGQLHFSDVLLDTPQLWINTASKDPSQGLPGNPLQGFARAVQVDSLTVRNGALRLRTASSDPPSTNSFELLQLHAGFQQLGGDAPIGLQFSGHLRQQGHNAVVQGHGRLQPAPADWRQSELDLELLVRQFQPGGVLSHFAPDAPLPELAGTIDLRLNAHGSPAEGLQVGVSSNGNLTITLDDGRQLSLSQWQAEGRWQTTAQHHHLSDLRLDLDGLTFTGALRMDINDQVPHVTGMISSSPLPVMRLAPLLPHAAIPAPWLETLRTSHDGLLQFEARFAVEQRALSVTDAQFALWDGALLLPGGGKVEALSLLATLAEDGTGHFEGETLFHDLPLAFSGAISDWAKDSRQIRAEVNGAWPAEQLMAHIPEGALTEGLRATGQVPWQLSLENIEEGWQLEGQADLLRAALHRGDFTIKKAGQPGQLLASAAITPQRLTLQQGTLQLPLLMLEVRGHRERHGQERFALILDATVADLRKLRSGEEWLDKLQLRGGVDLHYQLTGAAGTIDSGQGTLRLRRVGLHLGVIADPQEISGRLRLLGNQAESIGALRGKIGESPAKATLRLHDFRKPVLDLQVEAEAIRANELIFPSTQMILRKVHGGLRITGDGLDFQGIRVRLDGGTEAVVDGSLRNYFDPVLELQVAASHGNIDEVIALWQHPAPPPPRSDEAHPWQTDEDHAFRGHYRILAQVERGQLGDLRFEEAKGEITLPGGDLLIDSLTFQVGAGRGAGQVRLLTGRHGNTPLLKISGTVENFDAAAIYNQLLKRRGVVSGTLRGDFHLQGEVGKDFLASSSGGGEFTIDHGVLRRFRFISKVFSILNVAQVLSFKLPDMAEDGMPFRRLHATFALKEGVLSTEDLLIDSNAMNLSLLGTVDLGRDRLDLLLGVKPLGTVDRILTRLPLAGWILTGEEKALITAHFQIRGSSDDPEVAAIPISSLSDTVIGIFSRVLGLPGKLIGDLGDLLEGSSSDKTED